MENSSAPRELPHDHAAVARTSGSAGAAPGPQTGVAGWWARLPRRLAWLAYVGPALALYLAFVLGPLGWLIGIFPPDVLRRHIQELQGSPWFAPQSQQLPPPPPRQQPPPRR